MVKNLNNKMFISKANCRQFFFRLEKLFLYTTIGWLLSIRPTTYGKDSFSLTPSFSLEGGLTGKSFLYVNGKKAFETQSTPHTHQMLSIRNQLLQIRSICVTSKRLPGNSARPIVRFNGRAGAVCHHNLSLINKIENTRPGYTTICVFTWRRRWNGHT